MSEYLFVYGTLRPAIAPPELQGIIQQWRAIGHGYVRGRLYDLGEYPGAVLDPRESRRIVGELYELPDDGDSPVLPALLALLDRYEGFDSGDEDASLFVRRRCNVVLDSGRQVESWIYVYHRETASSKLIANGDYIYARNPRANGES